ncbi:MAG: hypothetical protein AUK63_1511 [bacterium P3]|nr:MAG: hypothetical protein AUK63_1511 [bacterium P3]KWW41093.1 MAG: hypothetical protein F083_1260 [bacterium F083]
MPTKGLPLLILFIFQCLSLSAQGFCVEGVFSSPRRGTVRLTLFEGQRNNRALQAKVRDGRFVIEGEVERPVAAELWHSSMAQPLFFYVENSRIRISVDDRQPAMSRVSGSRSNSEYRLAAEQWDEAPDYASPYAPLILLQRGDGASLPADCALLHGVAREVPHYRMLLQRVERILATEAGTRLPHFEFVDTAHRRVAVDTLLSDTCCNVLFFSASYCRQCERQLQQLQRLARGPVPLNCVVCRIDDDPLGWDAACVDLLAIDHIPYIILVDTAGIVVDRDVRIWELERMSGGAKHKTQ